MRTAKENWKYAYSVVRCFREGGFARQPPEIKKYLKLAYEVYTDSVIEKIVFKSATSKRLTQYMQNKGYWKELNTQKTKVIWTNEVPF